MSALASLFVGTFSDATIFLARFDATIAALRLVRLLGGASSGVSWDVDRFALVVGWVGVGSEEVARVLAMLFVNSPRPRSSKLASKW